MPNNLAAEAKTVVAQLQHLEIRSEELDVGPVAQQHLAHPHQLIGVGSRLLPQHRLVLERPSRSAALAGVEIANIRTVQSEGSQVGQGTHYPLGVNVLEY